MPLKPFYDGSSLPSTLSVYFCTNIIPLFHKWGRIKLVAQDLRRRNPHSWGLKFHHAQHPTCPSMVLPETYRACFVSSKFGKNEIYFIVLLNYRYYFVCYERSDGNMEKRAYHDVPANGNTFASVFLATESTSILQCF